MGKRRRNSGCEIRDSPYSSCIFQIQGWRVEVERVQVERVESEASDCEIVYVFATPHREGIRARKRKLKIALFKIEATD
jgi:hypothetical protein